MVGQNTKKCLGVQGMSVFGGGSFSIHVMPNLSRFFDSAMSGIHKAEFRHLNVQGKMLTFVSMTTLFVQTDPLLCF
jgi:hypothetical protein